MKKILIAAIAALSLSGCAVPTPAEEPELVTDIVIGTVLTAEGDGEDEFGGYISYRDVPGIEPGDTVVTALTRYEGAEPDDTPTRTDRILEGAR